MNLDTPKQGVKEGVSIIFKIIKYSCATIIIVLVAFNYFVLNIPDLLEIGKTNEIHDEGCIMTNGMLGAEDQTRWNDKAMLTGQADRYDWSKKKQTHSSQGSIWVISADFTKKILFQKDVVSKKLEIEGWPEGVAFQPHGIDVHYATKTVYAVSHAQGTGGERIEVLKVNTDSDDIPTSLTYMYSIASEEMNIKAHGVLNSVSIIEPNVFYVTQFQDTPHPPYGVPSNDLIGLFRSVLMKTTKVWLMEVDPVSKVPKMTIVAEGLAMANGIAMDTNMEHVYVADSLGKSVNKYKRDSKTNLLTKLNEVKVNYVLDNLKYDPVTDSVFTGGIVSMSKLGPLQNTLPERVHVPHFNSTMLQIHVPSEGPGTFKSLAVSDKLMFSSNGLKMTNWVAGGSPVYDGVLICPIRQDAKEVKAPVVTGYQTKMDEL